jgi:hypothetical protein
MAGGWQEGKEEKLTEMEGCVYKNEVILWPGPDILLGPGPDILLHFGV